MVQADGKTAPPEILRGRTALITGAARRIGRAIALALAAEGVNIVVHSLRAEGIKELRDELESKGVKSWAVTADFEKAEEYKNLIARVIESAGPFDILVNNASIFPTNTLEDISFESLVLNMEVNAWAPFVLIRDFVRLVGKGKIINLLDSRIEGYDWNHVAYILSKHVLSVLTKMTALQFAPAVTVNGISPGMILPPPGWDYSYLDQLTYTVPLKRYGNPRDIADAALYLLKSNFLTGTVINVDGGRHLMDYGHGPHPD